MGLEPTTFRVTGGRSNQTELQLHHNFPSVFRMVRLAHHERNG